MPDFGVFGTKRSGKSLFAVQQMLFRLRSGLKVCSNIKMFVERIDNYHSDALYFLIPEIPASYHLAQDSIGYGNSGNVYNTESNGLLVLDEVSEILQSRNWSDKDRADLIHEIIHLGKRMWDTMYITHGISVLDSQIRENHLDKVILVYSLKGKYSFLRRWMPDISIARIFEAKGFTNPPKPKDVISRHLITDTTLHTLYATNQIFSKDNFITVPYGFSLPDNSIYVQKFDKRDKRISFDSSSTLVDTRAVCEMIPPQYQDCFPDRLSYLNTNSLSKYIFGFLFLGITSIWKYILFATVFYILYLFIAPIFSSFASGESSLIPTSTPLPNNHYQDANVLDSSSVESTQDIQSNQLKCKIDIFDVGVIANPSDDFFLSMVRHHDFKISNVFNSRGFPKYTLTFYDSKKQPVDVVSSSELDYMGWRSVYWGFDYSSIGLTNASFNVTILYHIPPSNASSSLIDSFVK